MSIESIISSYGALGVLAASIFEELLSFIPSTLVHATAGIILMNQEPVTWFSVGRFFIIVSIPISVGAVIGSLPFYYLSKSGSDPVVSWWGPKIGIKKTDVDLFRSRLTGDSRDNVIFFLLRLIPIIPNIVFPIVAGFIRMPTHQYIYSTLGSVFIRASVVAFIGWQFGARWHVLIKHPLLLTLIGAVIILTCWMCFHIYRDYSKKIKVH